MAGGMENEQNFRELLERLKGPVVGSSSSPAVRDSDALLLGLDKPLTELVGISRSDEGRAKLAQLSPFTSILELFDQCRGQTSRQHPATKAGYEPEASHILLSRNLCAGDATNQDAFLEAGGVAALAPIATDLLRALSRRDPQQSREEDWTGPPPEEDAFLGKEYSMLERITSQFDASTSISTSIPLEQSMDASGSRLIRCLQFMLQLLGNFAQRGKAHQAAVWEAFFPSLFLELAALRFKEICSPLCMVLQKCCQKNEDRCWQLCQGGGAALVALLMVSTVAFNTALEPAQASASQEINWFEFLVEDLCSEELLFPLLFVNLGLSPLGRTLDPTKVIADEILETCQLCLVNSMPNKLQAGLLYILCDCSSSQCVNVPGWLTPGGSDQVKYQEGDKLPLPLTSLRFMVDILRRAAECAVKDIELNDDATDLASTSVSVQILEAVLSLLRTASAWDRSRADHEKISTVLLSHGLIDLLLGLLEALGPPEGPNSEKDASSGMLANHGVALQRVKAFPGRNPYEGYRRDIVAVIANISHRSFVVQERVRENDGLLLVLQQCTVEKGNPFLREWGLWAMRNLLEANEKNQMEIAGLQVKQSVNLPELRRMGLNLEIDPNTGRPRLVNDSSAS